MLKQKYFLTGIFILSAERQPIKLAWRKIVWLRMCLSEKTYSMTSLSINELQKSFKKEPKNSQIYLDVIDKLSTFAPALLERQSLMVDILLQD